MLMRGMRENQGYEIQSKKNEEKFDELTKFN